MQFGVAKILETQNSIIYYVLRAPPPLTKRHYLLYFRAIHVPYFPLRAPKVAPKRVPKWIQNRFIFGAFFEVPFRTPLGPLWFPKWYQKEIPKVTLF